jgi:hypothetical protein
MAPQTLKQHPGKLVAPYDFLASLDSRIDFNPLLYELDGDGIEYRIVPQYDLIHKNLHQRLGRCPTPMSGVLTRAEGASHVKLGD